MNQLTTPFIEKMDRDLPWNEYPRPSMVRDSFLCLNGRWDFAISDTGTPEEYKEKILVPFPPESMLSEIGRSTEYKNLYYRRYFRLPEGFLPEGYRLILHFGAVDQIADVYVNGEKVTHHEGGYLPFYADVTDKLREENELRVRVRDTLDLKYPYGKQTKKRGGMWYTPVSGIWQTVWLEAVPENHIKGLKITTDDLSATIKVFAKGEKTLTLDATGDSYTFEGDEIVIRPTNPEKWSPESPFIYNFTLKCGDDRVRSYFALRKIETVLEGEIPRIHLNGEPYVFTGLLDQGYYPDGIFLPPTSEGYEYDIKRCQEMGFNMLRKHIKIEPEIFYYLCDTLGMVVFQDMVNNSDYNYVFDTVLPTIGMKRFPDKILHRDPEHRRIFREHMLATLEHLHNFPSILYYTIFNEGWGQWRADENFKIAKEADPTRIYDATSGWFWRSKSDVDSRHVYFKKVKLGQVTNRPIVISEFGGYSYRVEGHLYGDDNYGYTSIDDQKTFEDKFVALYENEILPIINSGVSALVYTQVSDVEDETNGIMTYDRKVTKMDVERIHELMMRVRSKIKKNKW